MNAVNSRFHVPEDFLNPNSMLTPGVAGALVFTISIALQHLLGNVSVNVEIIAFILSFLLGLLLFSGQYFELRRTHWIQRLLYYFFNSLIIYSMAIGSLLMGGKANQDLIGMITLSTPAYAQDAEHALPPIFEQQRPLSTSEIAPSRQPLVENSTSPASREYRIHQTVREKERNALESFLVTIGFAKPLYEVHLFVQGNEQSPPIDHVVYALDPSFGTNAEVTVNDSANEFQLTLDRVWSSPHVDVAIHLPDQDPISLSGNVPLQTESL